MWNILLVTVFLMLCCQVYSEDGFLNETINIRVKRGKYYSYPSRFYRRPPNTYPTKGAFSYTPPPGYMMDDDEPPHPGNPGKAKVSKRPNDGLRDDDINNIVKYLSKQDLDKLIDLAGEKDRIRENSVERRPYKREESRIIKAQDYSDQFSQSPNRNQDSDQKFNLNGPFISRESDQFPQNFKSQDDGYNGPYRSQNIEQFRNPPKPQDLNDQRIFNSPSRELEHFPQNFRSQDDGYNGPYRSQNLEQFRSPPKPQESRDQPILNGPFAPNEDLLNYVEDTIQEFNNQPLQPEESVQNKQISYLNTYIHHEINDLPNGPSFTVSETKEEVLPRPVNLREDDYDISYTNNVPTVVKPTYKVENFGELPLMSNAYKLDTVSSYKVPHYTVTSSKHSPPPQSSLLSSSSSSSYSSSSGVPLEPAPPKSAAKEQSDAHLKAIKIWTHRSKGTAYTLHNDGSLSLERQKTKYGQ